MARRVDAGSIILTPTDAKMLYQAAKIGDLRNRYRVGDTSLFRLLTDIAVCAFTAPPECRQRQHAPASCGIGGS